ncbi:hypothetical protein CLV84_2685 [Neolewinella xylanilytica]|uniref:Lipocalin-like protein n=1 Tax=Neolewinella xylanilytica TaxID=1514080 RepID=A0A2S6I3L5_9BACT|nr:hypothetical protein [Neolewinella xylanilytica]PPK85778.1 hypothetical protein CLV84_2685 [Neolewinella xylanilytica]
MRIFSALLLLVLTACGSDPALTDAQVSALEGRWELVEARRDNVKTGVLEGLYFDFGADAAFETNLLAEDTQSGSYQREGEEITTSEVDPALTYEIVALEGNRLLLRSRYQGFLFDFDLERAGPDPADPATEE